MSHYLFLLIAFALNFVAVGGKWNFPIAAWIAPIFVLRFYRQSEKPWLDFLLLWLATAIPLIVSWKGATFFPGLGEVGFFLAVAPIALIAVVIDRYFHVRFPDSAWMLFIFPIAATALDFFQANGSPFGTFGASAYSQRGFLPIMQIASVTGIWGITFVMSLFASTVNRFWDGNPSPLSWASAGLLVLILGLSLGRTLLPAQPEQTAQIAGFSLPAGKLIEVMDQFSAGSESFISDLHADELNQIRLLAEDGANIVVLQEGAGMGTSEQVAKLIADASALAKEKNIYIVLPVFDLGKTPAENKVHIIDPNGEIVLTHVKYGGNDFEGSLKGDGVLQTIDTPYGKLSAVICWDADFPTVIKQAGEQNVDLLFVPANDWREVKDIHAGMATFRAVENGMSIFRQTGEGVSMVTNAYGKVTNRVDMFEENASGFTGIQNVQTPIGSVNTLYPSVGDGVGNVMLLGLAGLLIGLFVTRQKKISLA